MREMEDRGVVFDLEKPKDKLLDVPNNVASLGAASIGSYYQNTLKWWQWILEYCGEVEGHLIDQKNVLENLEEDATADHRQEIRECKNEIAMLKIQQTRLEHLKTKLSRQMAMVSRSVEGFKTEWGATQRGENLGKGPRGGYRGQLPPGL